MHERTVQRAQGLGDPIDRPMLLTVRGGRAQLRSSAATPPSASEASPPSS